jgi:hypothetical protein
LETPAGAPFKTIPPVRTRQLRALKEWELRRG